MRKSSSKRDKDLMTVEAQHRARRFKIQLIWERMQRKKKESLCER